MLTVGSARACVIPGLGTYSIIVKDTESRLHSLWRNNQGVPHSTKLTEGTGAPTSTLSFPSAIVNTGTNTEVVLFNGVHSNRSDVLDIWHRRLNNDLGWENLSGRAASSDQNLSEY